ncbi:hypothetical protein Nepgr_028981 [Nepenthes gracilis]|uniref:Uncharacterized protein n=1 Tax=Nepenthes gracilis TaxID=150966 RepID=A0AAD3TBQ0_NEPGR|nr:hypothetical protein Nepgr_028981 [Nepenthes gracilis]
MELVRLTCAPEPAHGPDRGSPVDAINGEQVPERENGKRRNYLELGSNQQGRNGAQQNDKPKWAQEKTIGERRGGSERAS